MDYYSGDLNYEHLNNSAIIARIDFSPLVEIGVNKGHYYPEETTDEGPTQVDAETGTFFKLTNIQVSYNRIIKLTINSTSPQSIHFKTNLTLLTKVAVVLHSDVIF